MAAADTKKRKTQQDDDFEAILKKIKPEYEPASASGDLLRNKNFPGDPNSNLPYAGGGAYATPNSAAQDLGIAVDNTGESLEDRVKRLLKKQRAAQ